MIIFNVTICQLAKTSYVNDKINNLKNNLKRDIRDLEKILNTNSTHISQLHSNGIPKEVYLYNKGNIERNMPFKIIAKIQYENNGNLKHKVYFHNNGKRAEEYKYNDGEKNGLLTKWYDNGNMKMEELYKNGVRQLKTTWYETMEIKEESSFDNGIISYSYIYEKNGDWKSLHYKNGKIVTEKYFNKDGSVKEVKEH